MLNLNFWVNYQMPIKCMYESDANFFFMLIVLILTFSALCNAHLCP